MTETAGIEDKTPTPVPNVSGEDWLETEQRREEKLATVVAPDNGTPHEVLSAVLECANAWVPEARIIGNDRVGDIARAIEALAVEDSPVSNASDLHGVTKEWLERRAKAEGDLEIGAGFSVVNPTVADMAQMEVLAEKALPEWAQGELARLRVVALDMQKGYIAARDLVERAQAVISTSTYPNWHEAARAALSATATEGE